MSWYATELHKYVTGETRVDGWKSPWRIDLERRMAEEALKPRPFVRAKQIIERKISVVPRNSTPRYSAPRKCEVCGSGIRQLNKTGRCGDHKLEKRAAMQTSYQCGSCNEPIRKTEFGVCSRCFIRCRRLIEQTKVRVCAEPGCFCSLNKSNTYTKCRKHSRAERTTREVLRQRKVRALQRELREAA